MGGRTIARLKNGVPTYPHSDHLGSAAAATDASGNLLWREDYTPFGEPRQNPAGNADDEGFTGHIHDSATGLTYMQARYYDPVIGRFLSHDPVGFAQGGPGQFNRYVYAENNPINNIDPTGQDTVCNDDRSECVTTPDGTMPQGGDAISANNVSDENRHNRDALGTPDLDEAASELAAILNQRSGDETVYRMDIHPSEDGVVVISTKIELLSASPSGASFARSKLAGAEGAFHTEPTSANTGIPGPGDGIIPDRLGIPNYQAYGRRVNAMEISGGAHRIRPVNHNRTSGFQRAANRHQRGP